MDYGTFKTRLVSLVQEKLGDEYHVHVFPVRKNNGILLDNLSVLKKGNNISPCIYLRYYYERACRGASLEEVAGEVIDYYSRSVPDPFRPEEFFSRDRIRQHIVCRLVNTDRNRDILNECPHISFLNLSVIFTVLFDDEQIGSGAVALRYEHLRNMGLEEESLFSLATENMRRLMPADFVGIEEMIRELQENENESESEKTEKESGSPFGKEKLPLYVLTNSRRNFGAVWITDPETLKNISEKLQDDFFILPSSVHECLILPAAFDEDAEGMARMVHEINETEVSREEILSDSVYRYDRKLGRLQIAA